MPFTRICSPSSVKECEMKHKRESEAESTSV